MSINKEFTKSILTLLPALLVLGCGEKDSVPAMAPAAANLVFTNGTIYTADKNHTLMQSIAVKGDEIVFVGSNEGVKPFIDENTQVTDLAGKLILPGLHDVHVHPLGIVQLDTCDLDSEPHSLAELVPTLKDCISRYDIQKGEWLIVEQWAFTQGNEPSDEFPTLRSALDAVSLDSPIFLKGNDGHHAGVNSAALATAKNPAGDVVGINADSLDHEFSDYAELIGRDGDGRPNGSLNETARLLVDINPGILLGELIPAEAMPRVAKKLASYGITSVQDAAAPLDSLALYEGLQASGKQTFRLTTALYPHFNDYKKADGSIDIDRLMATFDELRARVADNPLIKADAAKIFIDGVIEGNPLVNPPTLPNAAHLHHYQQPLFDYDAEAQTLDIERYVDLDSELCQQVRADMAAYKQRAASQAFMQANGFSPVQCVESEGVLEHSEAFIRDYIAALNARDYTVHAHAIGDRAVRTAIDAFAALPKSNRPHNIGHAQLVDPADIQRAGELGLYVTMTYAWVKPEVAYDVTVTPFIDQVNGLDDLYNPEHFTMQYSYPAKSMQNAGAVLAAGSDAPVDSREPRPFVNIEQAVTRQGEGDVVWNANERLTIEEILDAYTIHGAQALRQSDLVGSLEVGKKADFAVLSQNIIDLAHSGEADKIDETQVLTTVFNGEVVFERQ
ncbi:amidohydrolase [Pseudomaricurvus sp.]|uniref:amidohydrolase n=1 Tax=Pseudomaricurvus sp. TaxID=2004510 RepID=UPI003F6AAE76